MRRFKRRRKKVKFNKQQSQLGQIVDMPLDVFKEEIVRQKVNVGTTNNLILMLESAYNELKCRKDAVMDLVFTNKKKKEDVQCVLEALYAEMVKLEQKIVYLKERSKELLKEGDTTS